MLLTIIFTPGYITPNLHGGRKMLFSLPFPAIDPVALSIGPFGGFGPLVIRWYALAYLAGFIAGWRLCMKLTAKRTAPPASKDYDDFLTWAVIGAIAGGRLGYVLIYNLPQYLEHPLEILSVWHGGMSFHGGLIGVLLASWLFAHKRAIAFWRFTDPLAVATPIGLFFGRLANFVNGELYGRATDMPWGMVFPQGGPEPRHPSQLYQAGMEGLILFGLLMLLVRKTAWQNRPGLLSGVFLIGYGVARSIGECFRQPDMQIGFLPGGATMGQLLSLPMILLGLWLIRRAGMSARCE